MRYYCYYHHIVKWSYFLARCTAASLNWCAACTCHEERVACGADSVRRIDRSQKLPIQQNLTQMSVEPAHTCSSLTGSTGVTDSSKQIRFTSTHKIKRNLGSCLVKYDNYCRSTVGHLNVDITRLRRDVHDLVSTTLAVHCQGIYPVWAKLIYGQ